MLRFSANLALQDDVYHMQHMEGDLIATLTAQMDRIGPIQIADNPGRHEPGTGAISFANLFAAIDAAGYNGWIGCEYHPNSKTEEGLDWRRPYLAADDKSGQAVGTGGDRAGAGRRHRFQRDRGKRQSATGVPGPWK